MANTIQDKLAYLEETKGLIKQAIVAKGVSVSDEDTFRSYADKIETIEGGGGTSDCQVAACFDEVGYTFVPKYIQEGLETAKNIKKRWNPLDTSLNIIVNQYKDLMVFFPKIETSKVTTLAQAFEDTSILVFPNNDFPALSSEKALEYAFRDCISLASVDFGSLNEEYVYSLESTFSGCTSLSRIWVNNPNTRFKLGFSAFKDCSRLDEENCNIFDYFDSFDNIDLNQTFYNSVILKDLTFTNPTSLNNAFYLCKYGGKNITLIYDNYTLTTTSYFLNAFSEASTNEKGGTLKITGNISGDYGFNRLFNFDIYDHTTSNFETLDITGLVQNNTNSDRLNIFKTLPFDNIIGLDSYIEPEYISEGNHNSMMSLILGNNTLKSFPAGFQTYYYNNSSRLGDYQIDMSRPLLYNMYQIDGHIDLSYISFSPSQMGYFLTNVGNSSTNYLNINLDNISFQNVTSVSEGWPANCYARSINMRIDFDSYNGDVDLSGLLNWTDHDSLIWSLITNSTDRTAQSLGTQNLILSSSTYNSLSSDEISQIQAKGYNVSYV